MMMDAPERFGAYVEAMKRKVVTLNRQIDTEQQRPLPDWQKLRMLKAMRLRTKDSIKIYKLPKQLIVARPHQNRHQISLETS